MPPEAAIAAPPLSGRVLGLIQRYRSAAIMAASRLIAVAAQFAVQMAVGALGGAAALGILQLFQSWTSIGGEVAARGLPTRAMRDSSIDFANGNVAGVKERLRAFSRSIALGWIAAAVLISIIVATVYYMGISGGDQRDYLYAVCAALLAAPLFALLRLTADTLKAMDSPTPAILVESLGIPVVLLAAAAAFWISGMAMTTAALLIAGVAGYLAAPAAMALLVRRRASECQQRATDVTEGAPPDHGDGNVLWATSLLSVAFLHLPFLVLPFYAAAAEIGVFAVANKLMGIITMLLILLAAVFGPAFARKAASGGALKGLLLKSQLYSSIIYLPLALGLLLAGPLLGRLFNVPPQDLQLMLLILAAGHLVNAATGLSGVLLNMAGAASLELKATGAAMLVTLIASPLVGSAYGYVGLAVLFSVAIAAKNMMSFIFARRFLAQGELNHETA